MARCRLRNSRPKALWGTIIPAAVNIATSIAGNIFSNNAQRKQAQFQQQQLDMQKNQLDMQRLTNEAQAYNTIFSNMNDVSPYDRYVYKRGGKIRLHSTPVVVQAGGYGIRGRDSSGKPYVQFKGGTHEDLNEVGGTGIYANVAGKDIEVEDNEIKADVGDNAVIISDRLTAPNGKGLAEAVEDGDLTIKQANNMQTRMQKRLRTTSPVRGMMSRPRADIGATWKPVDAGVLAAQAILPFFSRKSSNRAYNSMLDMYGNFDKELANSKFLAPSYVSMNTDFTNWAQHAAIRRARANAIASSGRNTASSNVFRNNAQEINTNALEERNKVFDTDAQRNLQARIANNEQRNNFNLGVAKAYADYNSTMAGIRAGLLADRASIYERRDTDNTALIQALGDAIGNFAQSGIDRYNDDRGLAALLATAQGDTVYRLRQYAPDIFTKEQRDYIDDMLYNDRGYYGMDNFNGRSYRLRSAPSAVSRITPTLTTPPYFPNYNNMRLSRSMIR